ncbi:hypothetical protein DPMN_101082 [Dreissena polymorpha]|uniref:Uncharacterized protein n=1 Tax=Dreissena polymorpha TaxID=45954 RepID=A0A9D4LIM9_DREPO|nr:hypothetical protein DPMN_101082 [Dreissena polymorpha]
MACLCDRPARSGIEWLPPRKNKPMLERVKDNVMSNSLGTKFCTPSDIKPSKITVSDPRNPTCERSFF